MEISCTRKSEPSCRRSQAAPRRLPVLLTLKKMSVPAPEDFAASNNGSCSADDRGTRFVHVGLVGSRVFGAENQEAPASKYSRSRRRNGAVSNQRHASASVPR